MEHFLIYITAANLEEARMIAKELVEKRLVACANIIPKIESTYWWEGRICQEEEVAIFAKTKREKVEEVISETKRIHSYTVPCIIALEIIQGNPDYLNWVSREVES